jgi:hypothetical protein
MKQVSNFTKVLVSVLMVLCVASFVACSKDEENNKYPKELVGKWKVESIATGGETYYYGEGEDEYLVLNSDGSAKRYSNLYSQGGVMTEYNLSWYAQSVKTW